MTTYYEEEDNLDIFLEPEKIALNRKGQPRKRKPKEPRVYFTEDTENAIIEYLASTNQDFRNRLYSDRIEYAFYKLAENIIHTFKFYYTDTDTIEELKHEVVAFLLEKLHLYNQDKGKAFSYFEIYGNPQIIVAMFPLYRMEMPTVPNKFFKKRDRNLNKIEHYVFYDDWFESYSKAPHDPESVIPKEAAIFYTQYHIQILEQYCRTNNIKLIWSVWENYEEIYNFLISRYGEWIVFTPSLNFSSLILWVLPLLVFLVGGFLIFRLNNSKK